MNDMRAVIVPKSDQMNADDLIGGPITITIQEVTIRPGTEQPVSIHFDGDNKKPFKPCKSMARVMVQCWGPDASKYTGRSMTLYRDPKVKWAGMEVGGIRISHMTDIKDTMVMALTETKGSKKPFTVRPLKAAPAASGSTTAAPWESRVSSLAKMLDGEKNGPAWLEKLKPALVAAESREEVDAINEIGSVKKTLAAAPREISAQIRALFAEACRHVAAPPADAPLGDDSPPSFGGGDDFPGTVTRDSDSITDEDRAAA